MLVSAAGIVAEQFGLISLYTFAPSFKGPFKGIYRDSIRV